MDILDLAREQLNSADQGQIIEKHREVFAEIKNFGPKAPNYIERTRKRAARLDEEDAEKARDLIERIVQEKIKRINRELEVKKSQAFLKKYTSKAGLRQL